MQDQLHKHIDDAEDEMYRTLTSSRKSRMANYTHKDSKLYMSSARTVRMSLGAQQLCMYYGYAACVLFPRANALCDTLCVVLFMLRRHSGIDEYVLAMSNSVEGEVSCLKAVPTSGVMLSNRFVLRWENDGVFCIVSQ